MQHSEDNEFDRRLRLVSLVYEVLRDLKIPVDATDSETLTILSRAFLAKMTALADPAPLMAREERLPPMFRKQAIDRRHRLSSH
jgi:hypothetical protein